jgi:hypothetical protein
VQVQAQLARYHAAKEQAAEHLAWFYATGDLDSLQAARPAAQAALEAWERLVALTDGVYQDDLIFGRPADQDGHWKDNLPYARHDLARPDEVEALFHHYGLFDLGFDFGAQLPPRTGTPPMPYLHDYSVERRFTGIGPQTLYSPATGYGWGGTYGLVAAEAPPFDGKTLRAAAPKPAALPREALYCDFVYRHPAAAYDNATFLVDLGNGEYEVVVILADRSASSKDHGPMIVRLQGRHELGPVAVPAGEIVELRQRVVVSAGRLDVEVSAPPQGDWLLTGLVITRVAPHIGHRPPGRACPGEPLAIRATVTGPEPVSRVEVHYRYADDAPFARQTLRPVIAEDEQRGGAPVRFAGAVEVPPEAMLVDYYLEAVDASGNVTTWRPEGSAAPRRVYAGRSTTPPLVEHEPIRSALPGEPLEIRARVTASAPLRRVTLHYRNVNQMQTHDRLEMERVPDPNEQDWRSGTGPSAVTSALFHATIPAEHVTAEWDLMYHLEAVDVLGNAAFYPGLEAGTPYIIVPVARATG